MPKIALVLLLALFAAGCFPFMPGTLPSHTFRLEEPDAKCTPLDLERRVRTAEGEPAVASILGCHVEMLDRCHALGPSPLLAKDLSGECNGATHLVRAVTKDHVEVTPLSLGDTLITGTYHGVMRQPGGPYEAYDVTMYLAQDGPRVTGVTRIATLDREHWGDLLVEGRIEGNIVFLADVEVLDEQIGFGLAWCAKGGYLVVDARDGHMTGPWKAPGCMPGKLELQRVDDHPRVLLPRRADAR